MKGKKVWGFLCVFVVGCFFGCIATIAFLKFRVVEPQNQSIFVKYGDSLATFPLISFNGKKAEMAQLQKGETLVIYINKNCGSCLRELDTIAVMNRIFQGTGINMVIIWEDNIDTQQVKRNGIIEDCNYSTDGTVLANGTPYFMIVDKNADITFTSHKLSDLIKRAVNSESVSLLELRTQADEFIRSTYAQKEPLDEKKLLLDFSMIGCPDCENAEPILKDVEITNLYQRATIYRDSSNVPVEKQKQVDKSNLLAYVYNIEWYPSYLVLSEECSALIGETPTENLKQTLLSVNLK